MAYQGKKRKLEFTVDRKFGTTEAKAGQVLDVEDFWASRLIEEGSAVEARDKKAEAKAEAESKAKK